jgi:dTMP kinase
MIEHNGIFIVFEGLNCSGKTTQMERLFESLCKGLEYTGGRSVLLTSQPGATTDSHDRLKRKKARGIELSIDDYIRDRAYHAPYIEEELHQGGIVLCSRYTASTAAYQGDLDPNTINYIHRENDRVTHGLVPDLVIYLNIQPGEALRRLQERNRPGDDQFTLEQLQLIAASYYAEEAYCFAQGQKWVSLNGCEPIETTADQILKAVNTLIKSKPNALP